MLGKKLRHEPYKIFYLVLFDYLLMPRSFRDTNIVYGGPHLQGRECSTFRTTEVSAFEYLSSAIREGLMFGAQIAEVSSLGRDLRNAISGGAKKTRRQPAWLGTACGAGGFARCTKSSAVGLPAPAML